jgi:hypothetical protein
MRSGAERLPRERGGAPHESEASQMSRNTKLFLDILMGAVIPILILNYLSGPLGAPAAYLVSALIPVGWVFVDLLLITRRFNVITSYIGLSAIVRGALAFWFVDGWLFALKDTAGQIVASLVFVGSVAVGWPIISSRRRSAPRRSTSKWRR